MALQSGFFDSTVLVETEGGILVGDKAKDAAWFAAYFAQFIGNGIYPNPANNFQITLDGGMTVRRNPGACFINGYTAIDAEAAVYTIPAAGAARTYYYVMRLDTGEGVISETVISDPPLPPVREGFVYDLVLAVIRVPANAAALTYAMVTDTRWDSSLCGVVAGVVTQIDTDTALYQLRGVVAEGEAINAAYAAQVAQNEQDFLAWFMQMRGQLSEDAAGYLEQNKADIDLGNVEPGTVSNSLIADGAVTEEKLDDALRSVVRRVRNDTYSIKFI